MLGCKGKDESHEFWVHLLPFKHVMAEHEVDIRFEVVNGSRDVVFTLRELITSCI